MKTLDKLKLTEANALLVLGIDTSGKTASVAICDENNVIAQTTILTKLTHSQVILPLVEKLLSDANLTLENIDAIVVANGPGSYTGLRIGISAVKAMCFTLSMKCMGISTLEALAFNCVGSKSKIISVMKARPEIAYFGAFESNGVNLSRLCDDKIIPIDELVKLNDFTDGDIILVGDYAVECYEKLFIDKENVRIAPVAQRLQLSSSLCMIALNNPESFDTPEKLDASYLQITKAEKDKETQI